MKQAFVEALILNYFDLEYHIRIKTDTSGYAIGRIFSQLTLDGSGRWHLVAFFSQMIILTERWYEIYNQKLLPIIEAFKTWSHHLEDCKHKVFVLIDYNNL